MLFEATDTKNANEDFYGRNQSKFSHFVAAAVKALRMHSLCGEMKTRGCFVVVCSAARTIKSQPKKCLLIPGRCLVNFILIFREKLCKMNE